MTNIFKFSLWVVYFLLSQLLYANDGSYYTSGNQLIPMYETTISVKKEILSIKRVDRDFVKVTVYYEFFNPGEPKTVEVGFEAASPSGDVDGTPVKGKHPYISDFIVNMNGNNIPYDVAIVTDSIYYKDGKFIEKKAADVISDIENGGENQNDVSFYYVYHFKANFKKGLNLITHTYSFKMSGSVDCLYNISYLLTGAKRWANKQIDDFTIMLDMGDFEDFYLRNSFFDKTADWKIAGIGKKQSIGAMSLIMYEEEPLSHFFIQTGFLVYQKMNFKPKGELFLFSLRDNYSEAFPAINEDKGGFNSLPIQIYQGNLITRATNDLSLKILRNLPYARRGYIFKSPEIQKFYESMEWYIPDPNYEADLGKLTKEEQEWLKKLALE